MRNKWLKVSHLNKKASDWKTTDEVNEEINQNRRKIKLMIDVLKENSGYESMISSLKKIDESFSKAYLDSGYSYDDEDPRNYSWDVIDGTENERAKYGTDLEEEIQSEIRLNISKRHLQEIWSSFIKIFDEESDAIIDGLNSYYDNNYYSKNKKTLRLSKRITCPSCEMTMINGIPCHETGCPDSWRDKKKECK